MSNILSTSSLTKTYKNHNAVNKVSLNVKKGDIYGFLGQNGAGKTSTIRMIMGLIRPTSGEVELFGKKVEPGCYEHFDRIGSLIEYPSFYPNLTAAENLEIHRRLMGVADKDSIDDALKITGIEDVRNKQVKKFSLGMKQRLGIARALLHKPELLILDEPTNGLDPIGIKEVRQLLLNLAQVRKITVFMSSHLLSEVSQVATKIGIIHKGELLEEIELEELKKKNRHYIEIKVNDDKRAVLLLEQQFSIYDYKVTEPGIIRIYEKLNESSQLNRVLTEKGLQLSSITLLNDSLEDYFVKLTGGAFKD